MATQSLNSADHFTLMMDHEIRQSGLCGNFCAIVITLDSLPDKQWVEDRCVQFSYRFPLANARLQAKGRQFFWKAGVQPLSAVYHLNETGPVIQADAEDRIEEILNRATPADQAAPIEIHLLPSNSKCFLVLRWFHPAFDAKGAELVLHHLFQTDEEQTQAEQNVMDQTFQRWSLWDKAKLAFRARNNIKLLDRFPSRLPKARSSQAGQVRSKIDQLSEEESRQILQLARKNTGLTGTSLYFIGCMMRAMELSGQLQNGQAYCVPYAMNLRRRKALFPVFSNQVSFLFAQAEKEQVASRPALFQHLREQNKNAIKTGLDYAMLPLMQAGSWLALEKYGQIVRTTPSGQERSSFWFSYTGDMDPEPQTIGDSQVKNIYQFTQLTAPPGLGLLVNHFRNRIVLSYNYVDPYIDQTWLNTVMDNMRKELLGTEQASE